MEDANDTASLYLKSALAKLSAEAEVVLKGVEAGSSINRYFTEADVNKDGELSLEEIKGAIVKLGVGEKEAFTAAKALLNKLDVDSDGKVPIHSLVRYLDSLVVNKK